MNILYKTSFYSIDSQSKKNNDPHETILIGEALQKYKQGTHNSCCSIKHTLHNRYSDKIIAILLVLL